MPLGHHIGRIKPPGFGPTKSDFADANGLTQSQQRLCRDLLRRWQALAGSPFDLDQLPTSLSSRDWLQRLREQVDAQVLRWP